uniref:FAD-dependent oxidoreductase n=1 Tax=Pararhizobium sp. IMCC3301 TaxID=3067904 RepID=UPI00274086C8|nr:FAD-binding protein [Pararhizobium sp. IMCC3301]
MSDNKKHPKIDHPKIKDEGAGGLSRRDFFQASAAAGVSAAALSAGGTGPAAAASHEEMNWDYEADIVVLGAGCTGLPAAIRARDLDASVLVIDQNFDAGGRMMHSGSWVSLGGGDPVQMRDLNNEADAEGFITVGSLVPPGALEDDVELLFKDVTDWSVLDEQGYGYYRFNNPDQHRGWAENCPATRQFLIDNYIRFTRINGTHFGGGVSRARAAYCFLKIGEVTDIKAGTITAEDAGVADPERASPFCPVQQSIGAQEATIDAVRGGGIMARCLEFSAREKGVQFMFNRHMDEMIRDETGRVIGVEASYKPRHDPDSGEQLTSYWSQGNIEETSEKIRIRARRAVVVGTGGHSGNPTFRSQFYPRMNEPWFPTSGWALLGGAGRAANASGIKAGIKVGASLDGLHQNLGRRTYHIQTRIATRDAYTSMYPGHPTFPFRKSAGISIGQAGFEHLIAVNQVGKRFFNEMLLADEAIEPRYPGGKAQGVPNEWNNHTPYDWRNCRSEWVREMYDYSHGVDAAIQINEGSEAPEYYCGPIWAIFDQAGADRGDFPLREPFVSTENGTFFKADTIEELAEKIFAGNEFQRMQLKHLPATISQWNGYVDNGQDPDFERGQNDAPMHRIDKPPYYAASIMVVWHDSYGGLRINRNCQVLDMEGEPIPGLYAGGEASGGGQMHGLGRATVHGYIAATNAVNSGAAVEGQ